MSRFTIRAVHRTGLEVTFQQGCDPLQNAHEIDTLADLIIRAGFKPATVATASAPVAGEERETVSHVLRGKQVKEGKTTPTILLYADNPAHKHSFLKRYLDRPADVAEFEDVCGKSLSDFPTYIGKDKPERGNDPDLDAYIVPVRPFVCVYKANARWSQSAADAARERGEIYTVPRRVFVRWEPLGDSEPVATQPDRTPTPRPQAATPAGPKPWPERMANIKKFLAGRPEIDVFNRKLFGPEFNWSTVPPEGRGELEAAIDDYAAGIRGWKYDGTAGQFREAPASQTPNETMGLSKNIPF